MYRLKIVIVALIIATTATAVAQNQPSRPSLLVNITVNGLDYDQLQDLSPYFGENGFNRIIKQGVVIETIDFGSPIDDAASSAVLSTGASPAVNGITAATRFDNDTRRSLNILNDPGQIGNFTNETYSPKAIKVSTLADEVRLDANGLGNVHSIAPDAVQAILGAGYAGNSAAWISETSGKWATTTYYKDLPSPLSTLNHRNPLSARLDTLTWIPTLPEAAINHLPSYKKIYPFRHAFLHSDNDRYLKFKASATVNTEVTNLAIDYIKFLNMGRREPIDMLSITYTLQPYLYGRDSDNRAETIDAYLRLDREIARLLSTIESSGPGLASSVIAISGTPRNASTIADDPKWGLPGGEFSTQRAMSLLEMNLMTIYGNGDWVTGYHNRQFFLNRNLIKERGLSLEEVARESADFLRKMAGVDYSATLSDIASGKESHENIFPPIRNLDIDNAGDLFISVTPGWKIISDKSHPEFETVHRISPSTSTAMILAPATALQVISEPVDARIIAPTLSRLLKVRAPSGASMPPLKL